MSECVYVCVPCVLCVCVCSHVVLLFYTFWLYLFVPTCIKVVDLMLTKLYLLPHRHKLSKELSGGMKRKLCVAIALMGRPDLLLLDEPCAGNLDALPIIALSSRNIILYYTRS